MSVDYKLIPARRGSRRTTIRINHLGEVEVRSPRWVGRWLTDRFVQSQGEWIKKALFEFNSRRPKRELVHGAKLPFFGVEFPLEITPSPRRKKVALKFMGEYFWASVPTSLSPTKSKKQLEVSFTTWYKKVTKIKLWRLTDEYCEKLGVKCEQVRIKNMRSRWGSCSTAGNINYNWRLALAPLEVATYVVIHEVCHLIHHHHQKSFWQLVESLDPKYREHRRWLKTNQHSLELL